MSEGSATSNRQLMPNIRMHLCLLIVSFSLQLSFDLSEYTADVDGVGTLRLLDAIRTCGLEKHVRFYQVRQL